MALKKQRRQRPGDLDKLQSKAVGSDALSKKYVALKTAESEGLATVSMSPTDEQLEKINKFTRTPKGPEDVVVLPTLACNDLEDRDEDLFRTDTVKQFASLPEPFSPIGKSFLVGHDHHSLPVGRIFDAESVEIEGTTFLKTYSYIPNIESNKSYIENLDAGVYWAVSVGVLFNQAMCSVGKEHGWSGWGWWCSEGHDKGFYYDPNSDEKDDWGYPIPCEEGQGEKCIREFDGAKDFYELSQVYLGAQYFAELADKDPNMRGLVKAASSRSIPLMGMGFEEAKALKLPIDVDPRLAKALRSGKADIDEDGSVMFVEEGLRYVYEDGEVACLGKLAKDADEEEEEDTEDNEDEETEEDTEETEASAEGDDEEEGSDEEETEEDDTEVTSSSDDNSDEEEDSEEDDEEDEEEVSAEQLQAMAKRLGYSDATIQKASSLVGVPRVEALLATVQAERAALETKAALGDQYVKSLRTEAIDWYVKAHTTKEQPKVKTASFEKRLDAYGDNAELLQYAIDEMKELAQAKFPAAVRRSTFEVDANKATEPGEPNIGERSQGTVKKIHG
jgi:hypothetical protein